MSEAQAGHLDVCATRCPQAGRGSCPGIPAGQARTSLCSARGRAVPLRPCGRGALKCSVPQLELRGGEAGGTGFSAQQLGLGSLPPASWVGEEAQLGGAEQAWGVGGCVVSGTRWGPGRDGARLATRGEVLSSKPGVRRGAASALGWGGVSPAVSQRLCLAWAWEGQRGLGDAEGRLASRPSFAPWGQRAERRPP